MLEIPRIKICGMTRSEDVHLAVQYGADLIGFIFADSARRVEPDTVRKLVKLLPHHVAGVGVFRNEDPDEIWRLKHECGLGWIQFHGDEPPEEVLPHAPQTMKTISTFSVESLRHMQLYEGVTFLLDVPKHDETSCLEDAVSHEWIRQAQETGPCMFAGRMETDSVGDLIRSYHPWGIDVCRGVESEPGIKDAIQMKSFMQAVRHAYAGPGDASCNPEQE